MMSSIAIEYFLPIKIRGDETMARPRPKKKITMLGVITFFSNFISPLFRAMDREMTMIDIRPIKIQR
jgi:hypothetical protein